MKLSITARVTLTHALLTACVLVPAGLLVYSATVGRARTERRKAAEMAVRAAAQELLGKMSKDILIEFDKGCRLIGTKLHAPDWALVRGDGTTIEKINRLESLQDKLKGKRGSKALSDITDMKTDLRKKLDAEITIEVQDALKSAQADAGSDNYARAMADIDALKAHLESDPLLTNLGAAHKLKIEQAVTDVKGGNEAYLGRSYNKMWDLANQFRYDEALQLCDDVVANAWFESAADKDAYAPAIYWHLAQAHLAANHADAAWTMLDLGRHIPGGAEHELLRQAGVVEIRLQRLAPEFFPLR